MGRRGRRRKQLLDDLKEKRGYCKLKEEALDGTLWGTRFGRGCGPVVRQTAKEKHSSLPRERHQLLLLFTIRYQHIDILQSDINISIYYNKLL